MNMKDVRTWICDDMSGNPIIKYYRHKNGEAALVLIMDQTRALLEALNYNATPGCSYDTFKRKIKALMRYYACDIKEDQVGTHLGRHLFGTRMLCMRFSMESVSRMMGHTSISRTEKVYARIDMTRINADYDNIVEIGIKPNKIAI